MTITNITNPQPNMWTVYFTPALLHDYVVQPKVDPQKYASDTGAAPYYLYEPPNAMPDETPNGLLYQNIYGVLEPRAAISDWRRSTISIRMRSRAPSKIP